MEKLKLFMTDIKNKLYLYRYDIFSGIFMLFFILMVFEPLLKKGHIVFSDIDFGLYSKVYLNEIFGLWNERWSTSTLMNLPRLLYILPFWILSVLFGGSGPLLIKSFILGLIIISAGSMYLFIKRIISIYFSKEFNFYKVFALVTGSLFYAVNPWVIFRIQHIYLLCGYSLFPLLLRLYFDIIDPKFQRQTIKNYNMFRVLPYWENIRDIVVFTLFYSVSSGAIHYFFYGGIYFFIIGVLVVVKNIFTMRKKGLKKIWGFIKNLIVKISVMAVFFVLFSFYWFGNYVLSILMHTQASQHNINAIETLSMFSKNSGIKNVLYSISYWWPMFDMTKLSLSFYIGGGVLLIFILYGIISRCHKYHIVLFFVISSVIFIFLSTGTSNDDFAPVFINFVTKTPVIGSMFRDPNKLVGLTVVGFAVLLTLGIEKVMMSLEDSYTNFFIKGGVIALIMVSMWFYIKPFREEFIEGFYRPVEIPEEMKEVQDKFINKEDFFSKVFYFPVSDNMVQAYTGIATPYWNKNPNLKGFVKATGDIHTYTSKKNTIFHHEGNIMGLSYFINYLQYLMDWGMSRNIGGIIKALPVDELAYHNEYMGQEERQKFNLKILSEQKDLEKHYENKIYTLYKLSDPRDYMEIIKKRIYTPYGLSKLETYSGLGNFDMKDYGVFFTSQSKGKELLYNLDRGDYLEAEKFDDLLLSNLPEKYYSFPFDSVESANIFLGWGKVLVKNSDWLWYLRSQGIENFPFDFDMGMGLLATTATSTLTLPAYKFKNLDGTLVADFDTLLKLDKFFKPDNPDLFSVQANPRKDLNSIPVLRGQVVKGDPKNIWQVAKSGYLKAKENNPYQFNLVVSGRGSNKLHIKVRFFDENMEEIGVSYVVAPKEEFQFDEMNFYGEYISPPKSKYMRLDLLTFQNRKQKNYWWIHDIKIKDIGKYKARNIFHVEIPENRSHRGKLYMRTMLSESGGVLSIRHGEREFEVDTKSRSINRLQWVEVGSLEKGDGEISVENIEGFNAVNAFVFIPDDKRKELEFPIKSIIDRSRLFLAVEAEDTMEYEGEMQTSRNYPRLSGGRGIRSQGGVLRKNLEILKSTEYDLLINMEGIPKNEGFLDLEIRSRNGERVFYKKISSDKFKDTGIKYETVIDEDKTSEGFSRKYMREENTLSHYGREVIKGIHLDKGEYILKIKFQSNVLPMSTVSDLHKFNPSEFSKVKFLEDTYSEDCSKCSKITPEMMSDEKRKGEISIKYAPTCSCDWYIYASKMSRVIPKKEYLVNFTGISKDVVKRHLKVFFLNAKKEIIDVQYINEVPEEDKSKWNDYQQLVKAPENSEYMQLQIWARGDRKKTGNFKLKNYYIIPYDEMILVDNFYLLESGDGEFFDLDSGPEEISYERVDSMKRKVNIKNPENKNLLVTFGESPNPLWKESYHGKKIDTVVNGVAAGFFTDKNGPGELKVVQRIFYYAGLILFFIGILLFFIIKIYYKGKQGGKKSGKNIGD